MIDLELAKRFGALSKASPTEPSIVDVPRLRFMMLDGVGGMESAAFQDAVQAIQSLASATRFAAKKHLDLRYSARPLEGLYWDSEGREEFTPQTRDRSAWRLIIMLPDEISGEFVDEVREKVAIKKDLRLLGDVRVETFSEGMSVQIMHLGPYSDETTSIDRVLSFCAEENLDIAGHHHEIYLGKLTRNDPAKLRTILRYGVLRQRA